jgi:hypothetical protein
MGQTRDSLGSQPRRGFYDQVLVFLELLILRHRTGAACRSHGGQVVGGNADHGSNHSRPVPRTGVTQPRTDGG